MKDKSIEEMDLVELRVRYDQAYHDMIRYSQAIEIKAMEENEKK